MDNPPNDMRKDSKRACVLKSSAMEDNKWAPLVTSIIPEMIAKDRVLSTLINCRRVVKGWNALM